MTALADILSRRVLLVTGKGGVGKTTVTAALAREAAASGKRVLAAEISYESPREAGDAIATLTSPLATALGGAPLVDEPRRIGTEGSLYAARLSPLVGHLQFLRDTLPMRLLADAAMKSAAVRRTSSLRRRSCRELGITVYRLLTLLDATSRPGGAPGMGSHRVRSSRDGARARARAGPADARVRASFGPDSRRCAARSRSASRSHAHDQRCSSRCPSRFPSAKPSSFTKVFIDSRSIARSSCSIAFRRIHFSRDERAAIERLGTANGRACSARVAFRESIARPQRTSDSRASSRFRCASSSKSRAKSSRASDNRFPHLRAGPPDDRTSFIEPAIFQTRRGRRTSVRRAFARRKKSRRVLRRGRRRKNDDRGCARSRRGDARTQSTRPHDRSRAPSR